MTGEHGRVRPVADAGHVEHDGAAADAGWVDVRIELVDRALVVAPSGAAARPATTHGSGVWAWALDDISSVSELAPFDGEPRRLEVVLTTGARWQVEVPSSMVAPLGDALRATLATPPATPAGEADPARSTAAPWWRAGVAAALLVALVVTVTVAGEVGSHRPTRHAVAAGPSTSSGSSSSSTSSSSSSTSTTGATTTSTTGVPVTVPTTSTTVPPPPEPTVIAPLTGLPVPASAVARNAIVSKIDASPPAMPPVGLDEADVVMEVKIEWALSRYIAVFHSRQPAVIGPHRSARTTDPDLLSMYGHPLLAFSGANPGVAQRLLQSPWLTIAGPGEVPRAWFRDESRPYPNNLFAASQELRTRPVPPLFPVPRFFFRAPGTPGGGVPVEGMAVSVGATPLFRWDGALGGWRRWIHDREHLHATGAPVAPTNVVVVETAYGVSAVDTNSPEALSVGFGRAWVFTDGHMVAGTWARLDRFAPYDLRDPAGNVMTLLPGSTWVVLSEGPPFVDPVG